MSSECKDYTLFKYAEHGVKPPRKSRPMNYRELDYLLDEMEKLNESEDLYEPL